MTGKQSDSETDRQFDIVDVLGRLQSSSHRLEEVTFLTAAVRGRLYDLARDIDTAAGTKLAAAVLEDQALDEIKTELFGDEADGDMSVVRDVLHFDRKAANCLRRWLGNRLKECDRTNSVQAFLDLHAPNIDRTEDLADVFALLFYVGRTPEATAHLLGKSTAQVQHIYGKLYGRYQDASNTAGSAGSLAAIPDHPSIGAYKIPARKSGRRRTILALLALMLVAGGILYLLLNKSGSPPLDKTPVSSRRSGDENTVFIGNPAVKMTFCWVPAGVFEMGAHGVGNDDDMPRQVVISRGFWMGQTEVTQSQWKAVGVRIAGDKDPTLPDGNDIKENDLPVVGISQDQAKQFCASMGVLTGKLVRLPTEAEWEYACRAGASTRYPNGDDEADLRASGWYVKNSGDKLHVVGLLKPNAWGLKDMHGNVSEWCADYYSPYSRLKNGPDPVQDFPEYREFAVVRGGFFRSSAETCSATTRNKRKRVERSYFFGFRACFSD
jgi:formylglycine-generating enzyme required for sulfatase activity